MMKKIYYSLVFLCSSYCAFSQGAATVSGKITDKKSNAINGASVNVLNTNLATSSNVQGGFEIKNLSAGDYTIAISALGYATVNETVHVVKGDNALPVVKLEESTNQLGAVVGEFQRDGAPDPASRTRDQRDLPLEIAHVSIPVRSRRSLRRRA